MFGSVTYGLLITLSFMGWLPDISEFVKEAVLILTGEPEDALKEYELLVLSIPTSAVLTLIWLFLVNLNAFSWILYNIGVIKFDQQHSFISTTLECPPNSILVIRIWDFENGRIYKGELESFKESGDFISLKLNEVEICDVSGDVLGKAERYIYSRPISNFEFEIITIKEKKCNK